MADIHRSLETIATTYSVFEKNQVLTHEELNSVGAYLDDQSRMTRLALLGAGIACGLRLSRRGETVVLGKGIGLTTDGDLLQMAGETVYNRFRTYDASKPAYPPFYGNGNIAGSMLPVYELIAATERDDGRMQPLANFASQTGASLEGMIGLLFMESFVTDFDLCTSTDCDNLGQQCQNTVRLLVLDEALAAPLRETVHTPHQALAQLGEIVAIRPVFTATSNTPNQLAQAFRTASASIHGRLLAELPKLYPACTPFLADLFADGDPAPAWTQQLNRWQSHFTASREKIQYYYDFLKDLAETWNDFRYQLAGERTWCCPDSLAFPKHLVLGRTDGSEEGLRTDWYPSPLISRTAEPLQHARFLARKIDTLIRTFSLPEITSIRITPSCGEEEPLEERAIPHYYLVNAAHPVHRQWNYRLEARGMATANYSYNAGSYGATGAAADPLTAPLGRFPLFRIEGHLGQPATTAMAALERQIKASNLPIAVRAIALSADRSKVVKRPGIRYSDLHRFHYLLRQDVSHQLSEAIRFSQNFKQKVDKAVHTKLIADRADETGVTYTGYAKDKNTQLASSAAKVRAVLNRTYSQYKTDTTWKANVSPTLAAAGQFKVRLTEVVKTEFTTPFDSLIGNDRIRWIDWLDDIIKAKDENRDDKLLFAAFLAEHPGIEHCGGVRRGGTFILIHDEQQQVVADCMLPYFCCDQDEEEPAQPPFKKPGLRPGWVIGGGITMLPSRNEFIRDKLNLFRDDQVTALIRDKLSGFKSEHVDSLRDKIETNLHSKLDILQKDYLGTVKESTTLMGNALIARKEQVVGIDKVIGVSYSDKELATRVTAAQEKEIVAKYLAEKAAQPGLADSQRTLYRQQAKEAEAELAGAIADATQYIATSKTDVSMGSEGMAALLNLNNSLATIGDQQAKAMVADRFGRIKSAGTSSNLAMAMDAMVAKLR